jgi:hypothetical protein
VIGLLEIKKFTITFNDHNTAETLGWLTLFVASVMPLPSHLQRHPVISRVRDTIRMQKINAGLLRCLLIAESRCTLQGPAKKQLHSLILP